MLLGAISQRQKRDYVLCFTYESVIWGRRERSPRGMNVLSNFSRKLILYCKTQYKINFLLVQNLSAGPNAPRMLWVSDVKCDFVLWFTYENVLARELICV